MTTTENNRRHGTLASHIRGLLNDSSVELASHNGALQSGNDSVGSSVGTSRPSTELGWLNKAKCVDGVIRGSLILLTTEE